MAMESSPASGSGKWGEVNTHQTVEIKEANVKTTNRNLKKRNAYIKKKDSKIFQPVKYSRDFPPFFTNNFLPLFSLVSLLHYKSAEIFPGVLLFL